MLLLSFEIMIFTCSDGGGSFSFSRLLKTVTVHFTTELELKEVSNIPGYCSIGGYVNPAHFHFSITSPITFHLLSFPFTLLLPSPSPSPLYILPVFSPSL